MDLANNGLDGLDRVEHHYLYKQLLGSHSDVGTIFLCAASHAVRQAPAVWTLRLHLGLQPATATLHRRILRAELYEYVGRDGSAHHYYASPMP